MSEVGSQSKLYEELYECAELVDGALSDLKDRVSPKTSLHRQELGKLLIGLGSRNWIHTPSRALAVLLRLFQSRDRKAWADLGTILVQGGTADGTVSQLEKLAAMLEQEQQTVMARIQGL
jgi:hypothetical protein